MAARVLSAPGVDSTVCKCSSRSGCLSSAAKSSYALYNKGKAALAVLAFQLAEKHGVTEALTAQQIRAARLANALRVCHKLKRHGLRSSCERQARRRYGPAHKTKRSAHHTKKGHKP